MPTPERLLVPALAALMSLAATAAAAQDVPGAAGPPPAATSTRIAGAEPCARADARWIVTPLLAWSALSGGRDDWRDVSVEVLNHAAPNLYLGGRVESRTRNDTTDTLYTALLSHTPMKPFEWHAAITVTSDPAFSVDRAYTAGGEWRLARPVSALFDYARLEFPAGSMDQYKPGLVWWLGDCNFLTGRYWHGRAFDEADYDGYLLRLDLGDVGLPAGARLAAYFTHGTEPEKQVGYATLLTTADAYGVSVSWPLLQRVDLILGAEYEDRSNVYTRTAGTVGLTLRF